MIEITCTKTEKEKLISTLEIMPIPCLFPKKAQTCYLDKGNSCRKCLEAKIKWSVREKKKPKPH